MMKFGLVALAGLVSGCGGETAGTEVDAAAHDAGPSDGGAPDGGNPDGGNTTVHNVSGTRIKMKWMTTSDGARVYMGAFDSARGDDCIFNKAADGKLRCLPTASMIGDLYSNSPARNRLVLHSAASPHRSTFCSNSPPQASAHLAATGSSSAARA